MKNKLLLKLSVLALVMALAACGVAEATKPAVVETETVSLPEENLEEISSNALPEGLIAQLDAFLASQIYSEGGDPTGAAPGLVLLVDTPEEIGRASCRERVCVGV